MNVLPTKDELEVMEHIASILMKSGFYPQLKSHEQAVATILRGWGLGLSPADSLSGINILHGKLTMSSGLIASLMMRAGFSWKSISHTEQECIIEVRDANKEVLGEAGFTIQDAHRANLIAKNQNWTVYPKDMLFARTISAAARRYAPIAFGGAVYTPDELQDNNTTPNIQPAAPANVTPLVQPKPAELPATLTSTEPRTGKQNAAIHALYGELYPGDDAERTKTRRLHVALMTGGEKDSSADLTEGEATQFIYALETLKLAFGYYGKPIWETDKETEVCQRLGKDSLFELSYSDLETFHHYLLNKLSEKNAHADRRLT